jgi:hypothetical protein
MPTLDPAVAARCRMGVQTILEHSGLKGRGREKAVFNYIFAQEIADGTAFVRALPEHTPYIVLGSTGEIHQVPPAGRGGGRLFAYLYARYGISERESLMRLIYDALRLYILQSGVAVNLRRFACYTGAAGYLSSYDGRMWKLDGVNPPERVMAGEDDVFFADDDGGETVEPDIGPHGILLDRLTALNFAPQGQGGITPDQQRKALMIWLLALGLPDLLPTKPILMVEGGPGSGKSAAVQLIQAALMGSVNPIILDKSKESDFGVLLLRSPIAVFDNTDSYVEWVADAICAYATNGQWKKRKLYTDNEEVILKPHAFIAVASKNPVSFRREDVADRSIVLRLERRETFRPFKDILADVYADRPRLFGEYLYLLNQVIADIQANGLATEESLRMADFAAVGRVVSRVLGWEEGELEAIMEALQSERDAFINEEDPLVDLLAKWLAYTPRAGGTNAGREVSLSVLFSELEAFATGNGAFFYKTSKLLAQKLRSTHVDREFTVEHTVRLGQKYYRIWRRGALRAVPDLDLTGEAAFGD